MPLQGKVTGYGGKGINDGIYRPDNFLHLKNYLVVFADRNNMFWNVGWSRRNRIPKAGAFGKRLRRYM